MPEFQPLNSGKRGVCVDLKIADLVRRGAVSGAAVTDTPPAVTRADA